MRVRFHLMLKLVAKRYEHKETLRSCDVVFHLTQQALGPAASASDDLREIMDEEVPNWIPNDSWWHIGHVTLSPFRVGYKALRWLKQDDDCPHEIQLQVNFQEKKPAYLTQG